uniref:Zinc carboxypeptidase A 1 n=1 Tax=Panagrellus redivivus TaxID=6233 RepID=A0A7E4VHY7_PANRE
MLSSATTIVVLLGFGLSVAATTNGASSWQLRRHYDENMRRNYRNYKLIRITPRNEENLDYLRDLYHAQSPYELDFWQPPTHIGGLVDVTVAPQDAEIFVRDLDSKQVDYLVAINDLEQAIYSERSHEHDGFMQDASFRFDKYNNWPAIEEYLYQLRDENPGLVTLIEIGRTHENRSILVVKVSGQRSLAPERVSLWLDAGIHAREWIAPATALIVLDKLVNGYKRDPEVQAILDNVDWYILPVMNPDGYEYTHVKNRMWRKNRRPAQCKKNYFHTICCSGVDLNRNFDWFFGSAGASSDPCHETYHGPAAFSEPESRSVKEFLEKNPVKAFVTLHSYSQLWLIPYGHRKRAYPQDYSTALRPLALRATKALNKLYGTKYAVGTGADLMYEAAGASHDYAKGTLHIPYAYLVELRPKSSMFANGFLLPEKEIKGTGEETWEALKIVADEMIGQFVQPKIRPSTVLPAIVKVVTTKPVVTAAPTPEPWTGTTRAAPRVVTTERPTTVKPTTTSTTTTVAPTTTSSTTTTTTAKPTTTSSTTTTTPAPTTTSTSTTTTTTTPKPTTTSTTTTTPEPTTTTSTTTTTTPKPTTTSTTTTTPAPTTTSSTTTTTTTTTPKPTTTSTSTTTTTTQPSTTTTTTEPTTTTTTTVPTTTTTTPIPTQPTPKPTRRAESRVIVVTAPPPAEVTSAPIEESTSSLPSLPQRIVKCKDYGSYCKWWKVHNLCDKARVQQLCALSCLPECQI